MAHPIEAFAREAFAAGWASTAGPLTNRVSAASRVAVQLAADRADDPHILEATLQFGKLEGLWAQLFQRREDLTEQHARRVAAAWRAAVSRGVLEHAVRAYQRGPLGEAGTATRDDVASATAAVAAALTALPQRREWTGVRQAMRDAIAAGRAEGEAGAQAITGGDGSGWDAAFQAVYDVLDGDHTLWAEADTRLRELLDRATRDMGRALAAHATSKTSEGDLVDGLDRAVDSGSAPTFTTDWALGIAFGAGMLARLKRQGITKVNWVTAGDGNVCETCDANEAGSPYPIDDIPAMPAHPQCRCVVVS